MILWMKAVPRKQCRIEFTYQSHCVYSKNVAPLRMHLNWVQIAQIIAKCHSFPNMYDMLEAKVDRLAGKTYFVQKNT